MEVVFYLFIYFAMGLFFGSMALLHLFYVQAEREIQKGPHENLQGFLDAVDRLRSIERFFSSNRSYRSSDGVLNHVNALLSKALVKMEGEFQNQLSQRRFVCHY
jgi:hypothetical protein